MSKERKKLDPWRRVFRLLEAGCAGAVHAHLSLPRGRRQSCAGDETLATCHRAEITVVPCFPPGGHNSIQATSMRFSRTYPGTRHGDFFQHTERLHA